MSHCGGTRRHVAGECRIVPRCSDWFPRHQNLQNEPTAGGTMFRNVQESSRLSRLVAISRGRRTQISKTNPPQGAARRVGPSPGRKRSRATVCIRMRPSPRRAKSRNEPTASRPATQVVAGQTFTSSREHPFRSTSARPRPALPHSLPTRQSRHGSNDSRRGHALGIEGGDIDDAHAILFAAAHQPPIDIVAVTVVAGNATLASASRSTRLVCELCRVDVPVSEGASKPADRDLSTGHAMVVGKEKQRRALDLRSRADENARQDHRRRCDRLRGERGELDILAVGPLTNIAAFLSAHADLKKSIRRIVTMGGWFTDKDRKAGVQHRHRSRRGSCRLQRRHPDGRHSLRHDPPHSAQARRDRTLAELGDPGRLFYEGTFNWMQMMHSKYNLDGCHLHDPLAAVVLRLPGAVQNPRNRAGR